MKKRYVIATAAALVGGGMLVEMQVGSKGLDRIELAAAGGGGGGAGALQGGGGGGAAMAVSRPALAPIPLPMPRTPPVEDVEEAEILTTATDDGEGLRASASTWGEPAGFDGILVQGGPAGDAPALPVDVAMVGFDAPTSYPLAGDINRASGGDALSAALAQPMAFSTVPEPATWLSLIVGIAMIGFNLRRRSARRSVAS